MHNYLDELNEAQYTAVTADPGPILVLAGPGSGKTRVLTHRIVYLIRELRVPPWHILAVTFTNKAAREMSHRIEKVLEGQPRGLTMGTFHASCARILRIEAENLEGYGRDFVIFDTEDQLAAIKQALKDLNLDDKKFPPFKMRSGIGSAKNELITPEMYIATNYVAEVTKRVYARYQQILVANNAMDFDDLLMNVVALFDRRADVLAKYQERFQHILVDEFQDTNTAQYGLLKRLTAVRQNIFAVGDADQSIYMFRGADYRNLNRFREDFPNARQILLEENYRSTQVILDAAMAVIKHNRNRVHKQLFTRREGGENVTVREAYDENEEAERIVGTVQDLLLRGYSPGGMAVMYRTNAQSRALEEAFIRASIPYRLVGATAFYRRREIKDVIAYLRVVHNPADSISFNRIINTPTRGIGGKTQEQLQLWAASLLMSPAEAVVRLAVDLDCQHPFNGQMLYAWRVIRDETSVGELLDLILQQTDFRGYIEESAKDEDEAQDRWANVMELRNVAAGNEMSLTDFLEQIALVSEVDDLEEEPNRATLLTLHAAKGLEFPIVFLAGLEDGILPHSRSLDDVESLAEERRLFYVGITRAMDRLYISHAFRRLGYGGYDVSVPSRFLQDLPHELVDGGSAKSRRQQTKTQASKWEWSSGSSSSTSWAKETRPSAATRPSPTASTPKSEKSLPPPRFLRPDIVDDDHETSPKTARYQTGQKVRHVKFGVGTVIESKLTGSDEEVSVAFPEHGIKRLAASFANLEVIE